MTIELDVEHDFTQILDGGEPLTLRRSGSTSSIEVDPAWRRNLVVEETEISGGHATQTDAEWQFAWDFQEDLPQVGDALEDLAGNCWTILAIEQLAANTRLRCRTRELRIAHGLKSWVDVQEAIWDDLGSGLEIVDWRTTLPRVPAKVQPDSVNVDNETSPINSTTTLRIILAEQLELDHNHRLVGADGSVYQVVEFSRAGRIDALPVALVKQIIAVA